MAKKAMSRNFAGKLRAVRVLTGNIAWCIRVLKCGEKSLPPVAKSLALNRDLSVSGVKDIKLTESLSLVVVLVFVFVFGFVFFFFLGWILFSWNMRCSKCQMSGWNGVCLLERDCAGSEYLLARKGGKCVCQDKQGRSGATASCLFGLPFSLSLRCPARIRLWRRKQWRKRCSTQERRIGRKRRGLWNLYFPALAWGVPCP